MTKDVPSQEWDRHNTLRFPMDNYIGLYRTRDSSVEGTENAQHIISKNQVVFTTSSKFCATRPPSYSMARPPLDWSKVVDGDFDIGKRFHLEVLFVNSM